ncbi:MAG TPA: DUF1254 domain-containing protein [Bauldia sp.]|nr:DUF1254 domain-containing protein [Bauldia sp.]
MIRTILFALGGLIVAGMIHLTIVFLIPSLAGKDAWAQMARFGPDRQFHTIAQSQAGAEAVPDLDPRMMQAVCRFSLADGPVRITADLPDEFWSVAVFDRRGRNVYSLNDRAAERAHLDLVILTPVQMAQTRQNPPASLESAITLEQALDVGFVLIRAFVPDDSMLPAVTRSLAGANCAAAL